jgi:tetrapyrrole methylase family protein/MazG family protein
VRKATKFTELKRVFEILHGPRGCMWDKKQTHKSLIPYLKEESDEFIRAMKRGDLSNMKEELGDILLQVMFHSQIASREGNFDVEDVIDVLMKKLKRRHPHVFGRSRVKVASVDDIVSNWHNIKASERKESKKKKI